MYRSPGPRRSNKRAGGRKATRRKTELPAVSEGDELNRSVDDHEFRTGLLVPSKGVLLRPFGSPFGFAPSHDLAPVGGRAGKFVLRRRRRLCGLALRSRLRRVVEDFQKNAPRRGSIAEPKPAIGRLPLADRLGMGGGGRAEEARIDDQGRSDSTDHASTVRLRSPAVKPVLDSA